MVLMLVLMNLVTGHRSVDNVALGRLLVDYRLDVLVDVVVDLFASHGGVCGGGVLHVTDWPCVRELGCFDGETILDVGIISVLDVLVFNAGYVVAVVLWKNLAVCDGLDGCVVVVLMDFTINGCEDVLVLGTGDILALNCWVHCLAGEVSNQLRPS
jgi:hypothetical protein